MNNVTLMGRLTRDPDVRYTNGENSTCIARYTLAVDRRVRAGQERQADFISCVAFGKSGEFAEKYLRKGTKIVLTGHIQTGSYTNKDGQKIFTTDVVADNQEFAESRNTAGAANGAAPGARAAAPAPAAQQTAAAAYQQASAAAYQQAPQAGYQQTPQAGYVPLTGGNGGYAQPQGNVYRQSAPQPQQGMLDGFMNIPAGIDEELPFT